MSLFYVNGHLITESVQKDQGKWDNEVYDRIMIRTTDQAVRTSEKDKSKTEKFSKPICIHNRSTDKSAKTRISSIITEGEPKSAARVTIRRSTDTKFDSDVFIVALPYEGMIVPFEHDEDGLQIYKSQIVKSDKFTIEHNDDKYRRVVYFVVRPNHKKLGSDGWYAPECNLEVTFAKSNRSKKDRNGEEKWIYTTYTVRFGENGDFEISESTSEGPADSFDPDAVRSEPICKTVDPKALPPKK